MPHAEIAHAFAPIIATLWFKHCATAFAQWCWANSSSRRSSWSPSEPALPTPATSGTALAASASESLVESLVELARAAELGEPGELDRASVRFNGSADGRVMTANTIAAMTTRAAPTLIAIIRRDICSIVNPRDFVRSDV